MLMNGHHRNQHYALDGNGNIVSIYDLGQKTSQKYYCPYCHQEMISRRGKCREWHFAHKVDAKNCSYDKYLHSLAIKKIQEWYNRSENIFLRLVAKGYCRDYDKCKWRNKGAGCIRYVDAKEFDLKSRFPFGRAEMEYKCDGGRFIADILCQDIKGKSEPIFIEVYVTHRCEEKKISSGIRIIEFNVKSEDDIMSIISSQFIKEGKLVTLYNFHPKDIYKDDFCLPVQKFILFPSKKYYIDKSSFTCKDFDKNRKGVYEITLPYDDCVPAFLNVGGFYVVALAKVLYEKYINKNCNLCIYHALTFFTEEHICKLYKKCGNPRLCKDNNAEECSMFRLDINNYKASLELFDKYCKENFVDIWKKE